MRITLQPCNQVLWQSLTSMRPHTPQEVVQRIESRRTGRRSQGVFAFVSGAINAGGFLAVQERATQVTETSPDLTQSLVSGPIAWALTVIALFMSFVAGTIVAGALIARARHLRLHWELAHPVLLAAALLVLFGVLGANADLLGNWFASTAAVLLCLGLGLQSAIIGSIAGAEVGAMRTSGILTGIGIELGRWMHGATARGSEDEGPQAVSFTRLAFYATTLGFFLVGGAVGSVAFAIVGFVATVPLAAMLVVLAVPSMLQDLWSMEDDSQGHNP